MTRTLLSAALAIAICGTVAAQQTAPPCPAGTITCNNSTQHMGDTTQTASADNDQSVTNQAGNHSNSIASGVTINPSIQQSGNAVSQNGNSVQGGNASATGNQSDNRSSASTGASSANNTGMNGLGGAATVGPVSTGASTATTGPVTNTLTGGNNDARGGTADQKQGQALTANLATTGGAQTNGQTSTNTVAGGAQRSEQGQTSSNTVAGTQDASTRSGANVDASDHSSYRSDSRLTVLPEQPNVPMSISPASSIAVMADPQCGPYQRVIQTPVYGLFFGITHTKRTPIDHDDTLADPTPEAMNSTWGGRAIYTVSTVNLAGARSISLGGGGSSGGWGQGNTGTTSSMTAQVTHIQMRVCRMVVERSAPQVIYIPATPSPAAPVAKRIWHKPAVAKACPPATK